MNLTSTPSPCPPSDAVELRFPQQSLQELLDGNARFAKGRRCRTLMWDEDTALRRRLAEEPQAPIAATLGCCDSRMSGNLSELMALLERYPKRPDEPQP